MIGNKFHYTVQMKRKQEQGSCLFACAGNLSNFRLIYTTENLKSGIVN